MASVTYRINGKSDNKAVDQTKKSLESLGGVAKSVNNIFKGFMALKSVQAVGRQVAESVKAFSVQQSAIVGLQKAINNNAKMTTGAMQRLVDFTGQLQGMSIYGDEQLQGQAKFLAGMQLTEEQIKSTLKAAADLAGGGIGNLESNVKNLAKTWNGTAGELAEMVPGLKALTKEQLTHGDAVKLVAERYKGFGAAMAGTLEGKQTQVNNIVGDIKEKVGALAAIGKDAFLTNVKPYLEEMNTWLENNLGKIANVFLNLPGIAGAALRGVGQMIKETFKPESLEIIKDSLYSAIANGVRIGVTFMVNIFSTLGDVLKQIGNTLGKDLGKSIVNGLVGFVMSHPIIALAEHIPGKIGEAIKNVRDWRPFDDVADIGDVALVALSDNFSKALDAAKTAVVDMAGNYANLAKSIGQIYKPVIDEIIKEWSRITDLPIPPAIQQLLSTVSGDVSGLAGSGSGTGSASGEGTPREGGTGYSVFGGVGQMVKDMLADAFAPIIEMGKSIELVTQLMTPWQTILGGMFEVLEPIVNQLLAPLVGILKIIGMTMGSILLPVLQALTPIIEIISGAFIWFYNKAILPVGNFLIRLVVEINNFVANLMNGLIRAINKIPFVEVDWRMKTMSYDDMKLQEIDTTVLSAAGGETATGSSGGAAYTGAKDMYINIYFDRSYVNGDARDIALMLRNEINAAEALGY